VCIYDVLMGRELLERLPRDVQRIDVGKRCGQHSVPQDEITRLITIHARRGRRVVRLKGGDPGIFGRLAEEVEALDRLHLPYRALPGVSSLMAATTTTGMLLTRRGVSRGFCVMTPRAEGGAMAKVTRRERGRLPIVFFMSIAVARDVARQLMDDGMDPDMPAAAVFGGGSDQAEIVTGRLRNIGAKVAAFKTDQPGVLLVGETVKYRFTTEWGALRGQRVLLTASDALQDKAATRILDYGGIPVCRPLIRLEPTAEGVEAVRRVGAFDWVVLTSPSAVRCFGELVRRAGLDWRGLPKLVSCGGGTSEALLALGLRADIEPAADFGADGLLAAVETRVTPGLRVLRLRSDKAGPGLAKDLRSRGAVVEDCVVYSNLPMTYDEKPRFDAVFFASASAVESFETLWGMKTLKGKTIVAIGKPTLAALKKRGATADIVGPEATVESSLAALAEHTVRAALRDAAMGVV
jgi:uroporphyrinogen III methyltransferase/synthase